MRILLVDDDDIIRNGIQTFLMNNRYYVKSINNASKALEFTGNESFDLIITDIMMPVMNGIEFLKELRKNSILTPVILITAYASVEDAVKAMKIGAEDYLTKPLNLEELRLKIDKIKNKCDLIEENKFLKDKINKLEFREIIGESKLINEVKNKILKVAADPDVSVMIYGESGTGKELVAQNIHYMSNRRNKPFIAINCASLNEELLESELFGHVKGAFTNALKDKPGLFLIANNGSLFLDEVSEMSPRLQAKLLRVLQEKQFQPVGSVDIINIDVRILGASNQNLKKLIEENKFREDLFYRLNVVEISLPKLEERKEDIPLLINHFIEKEFERTKKRITLAPEVTEILINHSWRGNIRELENFIKMLAVITENKMIQITDLPESFFVNIIANSGKQKELWEKYDFQNALNSAVENFEKEFLKYHIEKNNGNISKTAEAIGLSRVSLYKKINQYNLLHEESVNT